MNNLPDELDFWFKYYHKDTILDALGNYPGCIRKHFGHWPWNEYAWEYELNFEAETMGLATVTPKSFGQQYIQLPI